jgi:DNA polymerase-3 subunit alpha
VVIEKPDESRSAKILLLQLTSSGSKDKDIRRLKRIHGFLTSTPGSDRFAIICKENGKSYRLEFPNDNTYINDSLLRELKGIVGESNVMVEG